ncbi:hemophore [Mycobacterium vicinigordonae]|uniref:Hemophore n=1 Tax=Mycobacterium vicinigordonae TaxID=1719132 RepID=A0A7D6I9D1_9MYCO|nr:hemophore [Mycobacterium vicinigordonae]QLL07897.1 hemophore [Mycobacterium vicinigordonae]
MKPTSAIVRRGLFVAVAALTGGFIGAPTASASPDPCAASEVARTIGTVAKQTGDYLDSHEDTNKALTAAMQEPTGPQSAATLKAYFEANPKVALDLQGLANPLNKLGTQCKLPITLPQALSLIQAAQGGGLPSVPGLPGGGTPAAGTPASPLGGAGPLPGPKPNNG